MPTKLPETESPPEVTYDELLQAVDDIWWLVTDAAAAGVKLDKFFKSDPRWHSIKNLYARIFLLRKIFPRSLES